ncbi:hypothetical protein, partial [Paenibacillus alvei]|uniref:hypothetical protein n=1 Tax=Paenibacillus alvei TaxID=44250 RepID=UPI001C1133CD
VVLPKKLNGCQLILEGLRPAVGFWIPGGFVGILDRWIAWPSAALIFTTGCQLILEGLRSAARLPISGAFALFAYCFLHLGLAFFFFVLCILFFFLLLSVFP